jgi:hypothetical protein
MFKETSPWNLSVTYREITCNMCLKSNFEVSYIRIFDWNVLFISDILKYEV